MTANHTAPFAATPVSD